MRKSIIFCCAILSLVVGCAQIPKPSNYTYSVQRQLQSATHWQQIARQTAERLSSDPLLLDVVKNHYGKSTPCIYIKTEDKSTFDMAFRKYLMTELINAGFSFPKDPNDSPVRIYWDLQLVDRNQERLKPIGIPEFIADVVVRFLTGISWNTGDLLVPHTELIVTTRFTVGDDLPSNIIRSYSDTYYINNGDSNNFYQMANANHFQAQAYAVHPRSIAAKNEAWRIKLAQQGLLSQ